MLSSSTDIMAGPVAVSADAACEYPLRRKTGSVTFSEKVHIYEFPRDIDMCASDPCTDWLAQRLNEDKQMCKELEQQWRQQLNEGEDQRRGSGGPYAGSLSWSSAARVEHMGDRTVQLVRVEQRKIDPCQPIHCVKGQIYVQNISFAKSVKVRYTIDSWKSWTEVNAEFLETIVPGTGGIDCFAFEFVINTDTGDLIAESPPKLAARRQLSPFDGNSNPNSDNNSSHEYTPSPYRGSPSGQNGGYNRSCVLKLAVRYIVDGRELWDNNHGANYSLVLRS